MVAWLALPERQSRAVGGANCRTASTSWNCFPGFGVPEDPRLSHAIGVGHFRAAAASPFLGLSTSKLPRFSASFAFGVGHKLCLAIAPSVGLNAAPALGD